jgi:lysyl-tRNA synthetase class 2
MDNRKFNDQELVRRNKLEALKSSNKNPFEVTRVDNNENSKTLREKYEKYSREELSAMSQNVAKISGRILTFRQTFALIIDFHGKIQVYLDKKSLSPEMISEWSNLDIGDIVHLTGTMIKTKTNELTLNVSSFKLISKSLKVLPEKFHGLVDEEERARRRYVDLIVNEESLKTMTLRSKIISLIRKFMDSNEYLEVETPILQPILGGAAAKPFITHHNTLDMPFYLRIAPELYLKRCIVGGFNKVYEIGRLFRNEGMDATHNPEFTTMEAYCAYENMDYMIDFTQKLFSFLTKQLNISEVNVLDTKIDLSKPFDKFSMVDLVKKYSGVDFSKISTLEEARMIANEKKVHFEKKHNSVGHIINLFFEEFVEKQLINPTFVYGHPYEISPLSKQSSQDPRYTERFELFIGGKEYANSFSELNDPIIQYQRFEEQLNLKELGDDEASEMDLDFVESLEYGMPPTAGIGIGIDRLTMLLTNKKTIRDVLLFPHMRNKPNN